MHWRGQNLSKGQKAPSTINQTKKLDLLAKEGVYFDDQGRLLVINKSTPSTTKHLKKSSTVTVENNAGGHDSPWFDGPWDLETAKTRLVEIMTNNDKPVWRVRQKVTAKHENVRRWCRHKAKEKKNLPQENRTPVGNKIHVLKNLTNKSRLFKTTFSFRGF